MEQLILDLLTIVNLYSKKLKTNMAGVMTLQLKMGQKQRRILDLDMFANALGVSEVASESLMIRASLQSDEYAGQKNECKVWNYVKGSDGCHMEGCLVARQDGVVAGLCTRTHRVFIDRSCPLFFKPSV